jgi:single-strand DNA-binding protein
MIGINRWTGIGNMTADPKFTQGDRPESDRCAFSVAVNKAGRDKEEVTFLDCVAWGKLAGQVSEYGRKGRLIYVEGEIEIRQWEDRDSGEKRRAMQIKSWVVRFLDRPPDDQERGRGRDDRDDRRPARRDDRETRYQGRDPEPRGRGRNEDDIYGSDLPF